MSVVALILAGGQSRRLFPFNKVLSDLTGTGRTLIQQAYDRCTKTRKRERGFVSRSDFFVLSDLSSVEAIGAQLRLPPSQFLSDPARRGTWPAILWAMAHLRSRGLETVLAVMSADHLIGDLPRFQKAMRQAVETALAQSAFVTIGVEPSRRAEEWRGFGAVRSKRELSKATAHPIQQFEEKPSLERARVMIRQGRWLWNAGMFFFRIGVAEEALSVYQPALAPVYKRLCQAVDDGLHDVAAEIYDEFTARISHPNDEKRLVDNTIDYALLMPLVAESKNGLKAFSAATALKEWADVGEWTVLRRLVKADGQGNTVIGRVTRDRHTRQCVLVAERGYQIDIAGAQDLVVTFSGPQALLLPVSEVPRIKDIVANQEGRAIVRLGAERLTAEIRGRRLIVRPKTL